MRHSCDILGDATCDKLATFVTSGGRTEVVLSVRKAVMPVAGLGTRFLPIMTYNGLTSM